MLGCKLDIVLARRLPNPWPRCVHDGVRCRRKGRAAGVVHVVHDVAVRVARVCIYERAAVFGVRRLFVAADEVARLVHVPDPAIGEAATLHPGTRVHDDVAVHVPVRGALVIVQAAGEVRAEAWRLGDAVPRPAQMCILKAVNNTE